MKKNAKGFTLIELLAVIVILAVIALIATPTILSMIDKSRKGAAEQSMLAYVNTIEKELLLDNMKHSTLQFGIFDITGPRAITLRKADGATGNNPVNLEIKGDSPVKTGDPANYDGQYIYVDDQGFVVQAELKFSSYYIIYHYDVNSQSAKDVVMCSSTKGFDAARTGECSGFASKLEPATP